MSRISGRFFLGWLVGAGLGLALSAASVALEPGAAPEAGPDVAAPPPAVVTVVGTVEITSSPEDGGRVVQIIDADERVLIVDAIGAGHSLVKHDGEKVSATGVVSRRKDGREVLQVSSFRPLGG